MSSNNIIPAIHVEALILTEALALTENRQLFSQKAPPQMFGWVLNTPLHPFKVLWYSSATWNEIVPVREGLPHRWLF